MLTSGENNQFGGSRGGPVAMMECRPAEEKTSNEQLHPQGDEIVRNDNDDEVDDDSNNNGSVDNSDEEDHETSLGKRPRESVDSEGNVVPFKRLSKQEKKELRKQKMIEMRHRKYERQKARKKQRVLEAAASSAVVDGGEAVNASASASGADDSAATTTANNTVTTGGVMGGPRKRDLLIERLTRGMQEGINVCVDLSYDDTIHNYRERCSLVKQLTLVYAYLKQSPASMHLHLASINPASPLTEKLHKMGFENWYASRHEGRPESVWDPSRIVILSPDATETLETLESDKIYVIGGIVDRTVRKAATLTTAQQIGAQTRRLPLREHLGSLVTHVLNVDHVFRILCDYQETKSWKEAIVRQVPARRIQQDTADTTATADITSRDISNDIAVADSAADESNADTERAPEAVEELPVASS